MDSVIEYYKQFIDLSLIKDNLILSYEERILRLEELQDFAQELARAGKNFKERNAKI